MRRSNLILSGASAAAGALALVVTAGTDGNVLGYVLGAVLLANAFVRYQLAQRHGR
jgi:hypothetical protein